MKAIQTRKVFLAVAIVSAGILASSFTNRWGGEGFEIYLNNKVVLQQFGKEMNTLKSIPLDRSLASSQVSVKYFHCGRAGKDRTITIKDDNNKTLKEWHYPDVAAANMSGSDLSMNFKVSDILLLQKNNSGKFNLYYSSSELPKGRLLASLICQTR
jgi:hypothetical protein